MFRLDGKTAVVTGAGSGIGEQIARAYAQAGASVVVADVDEEKGRKVAEDVGASARFRRMDVTVDADVAAGLAYAVETFGSLDILVNNAGVGLVGSVLETSDEDFARLMDVNVRGVFHGCRHAVPIYLRQGRGVILNMGSVAGLIGIKRRFAYCATKGAVLAMTRQLAIEYAASGIRCNAIAPGTVHTPFVEGYLARFHAGEEDAVRQRLHERQPVGRMGRPEEIAALAVYLASDEAVFVTGAVFPIDGGWTAGV
jgi:NAD(P)-dependent dehydrogenase (short-subunit alcohol dehydrogenase family)